MKVDVAQVVGAVVREVRDVEKNGKPAKMVIASRVYDTGRDDLWDALTSAERIARWFLPIEGELRLGGTYQFKGNAGGTITECEKPKRLSVTWEMGPQVSWVTLHLTPKGARTELRLEHTAHVPPEFWEQFGPGAVGVGWDGGFLGLGRHLENPSATGGPEEGMAWAMSDEGKSFYRACSDAWYTASIASGTSPDAARAAADRTTAFYTGGEHKD
jgi:uncharacterized protein YndB with AHSA1/START domain